MAQGRASAVLKRLSHIRPSQSLDATADNRNGAIEYIEPGSSQLLARAIRIMLDHALDVPWTQAPVVLSDDAWQGFWDTLCLHRIETFLPPALASGALVVPPERTDAIAARARVIAMQRLKLRSALEDALVVLRAEELDVRVLKGLATGPLDHLQAHHRRTADVDLLVRPRHFTRACELLLRTGVTELKPAEPAELLVERTFRTAGGAELDVHHRLFRFGRDTKDVLFNESEPLPDSRGIALAPDARLLHAACHLLISPPGGRRMSSLFDVAVLAVSPRVDLEATNELASRFGVQDIVQFAVWLAENVGVEQPQPPPTYPPTLINRAHLRTNRRIDLEVRATLADLGDLRSRARYVRFLASRMARRQRAKAQRA